MKIISAILTVSQASTSNGSANSMQLTGFIVLSNHLQLLFAGPLSHSWVFANKDRRSFLNTANKLLNLATY